MTRGFDSALETIDFLPLVKAYPALSRQYGEVACVAGVQITESGPVWRRLYPVPFRDLDDASQFAKYQRIRVVVDRHRGDTRPETLRPQRDSFEVVGEPITTKNNWRERRTFVEPVIGGSMCEIQAKQALNGTSLGAFRPKQVLDLEFEEVDVPAARLEFAQALAAQDSLFATTDQAERKQHAQVLEQIPWRFKLRYACSHPDCLGRHSQSIVDWEVAQHYRRVRNRPDWQDLMRQRWLTEMCGPARDTAFYVGNQHQHRTSFLILGIWWPPYEAQIGLGI